MNVRHSITIALKTSILVASATSVLMACKPGFSLKSVTSPGSTKPVQSMATPTPPPAGPTAPGGATAPTVPDTGSPATEPTPSAPEELKAEVLSFSVRPEVDQHSNAPAITADVKLSISGTALSPVQVEFQATSTFQENGKLNEGKISLTGNDLQLSWVSKCLDAKCAQLGLVVIVKKEKSTPRGFALLAKTQDSSARPQVVPVPLAKAQVSAQEFETIFKKIELDNKLELDIKDSDIKNSTEE